MKSINIVIFWYMDDWGLYGRTYENIARGLAERSEINKVICILPPYKTPKSWRPFERIQAEKNLCIISPNPRFFNTTGKLYRLRQYLNNKLTPLSAIKAYCRLLGFKRSNTILWVFPHHPLIDKLIVNIPHKLLVTQIVDNVLNKTDISEETRALVTKQYNELPQRSDLTITSSELNFKAFKQNSDCYLVENGLDTVFLSKPTARPCVSPAEKKPRIGYLGFISERTDLALLKQLALARPHYEIVIAGPDKEHLLTSSGLAALPNTITIPYVPYAEAPEFIRSLDVCLIPHIHSPFSQSMSPLKLFQYLASGRPIVSTEVAGTERWQNLIYVSDDKNQFISNTDTALQEDPSLAAQRIAAAERETWPHRIEALMQIISRHNQPHA